jgi:fructose-bisphosphate aldolase, class II
MLVKPGNLFKSCYGQYGIAAINIWSMEQVLALFSAAEKAKAPFIVQTTPAARSYSHPVMLVSMVRAAARIFPENIFAIHLDHGNETHITDALQSGGYTSVMIDASHDPFKENIRRTHEVVIMAHEKNMEVEAELGVLPGVEDDTISLKGKYTHPDEVYQFVQETGCDSLAIAVGTSHGAYKFSDGDGIQFDILENIGKKLPGYPLVLHGGSEVDLGEIKRINQAGGNIGAGAQGVPADQLKKAISLGICKVNIATDARVIWTRIHREFFKSSPELIDPVIPGKTFMSEFEKFILEKFEILGSVGKNQSVKIDK